MILLLHIAVTCLLLTFADNVNAIRCHECIPERVNNYCTDYKDGYPTAARQINCQKYCFKADGTFKVDYGIEKDRSKKFVVSACADQSTADALEIGNVDKCQSGDRAERLLAPIIAQSSGGGDNRQQSQQQQQQQQQYGQQQRNQYGQQMQQQFSFHLPGRLDDARYCRCETDLCNGATTTTATRTTLMSGILAIFTAFIAYNFS